LIRRCFGLHVDILRYYQCSFDIFPLIAIFYPYHLFFIHERFVSAPIVLYLLYYYIIILLYNYIIIIRLIALSLQSSINHFIFYLFFYSFIHSCILCHVAQNIVRSCLCMGENLTGTYRLLEQSSRVVETILALL
jgi:hypothetical protein